jgi:hypothetical protein
MEFPQSEYTSNINEKLNLYTLKEQVIIKDTSKITNDSLNISNDSTGIINDSLRLPEDSLKINNEIFKKQNELEKNKRDTLNPNVNGTENKVF